MAIQKRKRKNGSTAWGVVVYDPATGKHRWVGTRSTRTEAVRLEASFDPSQRSQSFHVFADDWLATRTNIQPTTKDSYTYAIANAKEFFGDIELAEMTHADCERYVSHLAAHSALTARVHYGVLRRVMRQAVRYGYCDTDPTEGATNLPTRKREREIRPLTREQYQAVVASVPEHYRAMFALWPLVGLRRGEMFGLKPDDVDGSTLHVRRQYVRGEWREPKHGSVRSVPLTPEAQAILAAHMEGWHWTPAGTLFYTEQGCIVEGGQLASRIWRPALESAGVEYRTFHDLRHTYATWLLHAGVNVRIVAQLLGHGNAQVTLSTYAHLMPDSMDEAASALAAFTAK